MSPLYRLIALLLILIPNAALAASATVIGYHRFDGHRSSMSMPMAEFEAHLKYLKESANVMSMDEFAGYVERKERFPPRTVLITIDDGWSSVMDAFALLKKYDLPFTLFLPMAYMANPAARHNLTREDIERLKSWPKVTFADHSFSHSPRLQVGKHKNHETYLEFLRQDLAASRQRFFEIFGYYPKYYAYPYGHTNGSFSALLAENGYELMFTTDYRPFDGDVDPRAIPRLGGHRVTAVRLKEIVESD
ncbi:polysaccharide deacetylase family protein [Desulfolutivibrio sulfoxidireducens]|uniref:polysaccharide deacetylase family protein n=1 Tax=Desulfolutivibrio sulfoxidireducens TaxID=2773299 RepID=UPI00159DFCFD|nr:polysaccharide deacetylase family protein [Desulfolutivibrio sulfoxidireducens]QLA19382.1 polysaccharide deacetylase family protein [Desulfolutivibrio sulfoxidireducens]